MLATEFSPEIIDAVLSKLTLDNCHIILQAPKEKLPFKDLIKEKYYGTEYATMTLDEKDFETCQIQSDEFSLPQKNEFIPENLSIHFDKIEIEEPIKIIDDSRGKIYFAQPFETPKGIHCKFNE